MWSCTHACVCGGGGAWVCVGDYAVGGWNLSVLLDAFTILLLPLPLFFFLLLLLVVMNLLLIMYMGHYYHCESYCLCIVHSKLLTVSLHCASYCLCIVHSKLLTVSVHCASYCLCIVHSKLLTLTDSECILCKLLPLYSTLCTLIPL